MAAWAFWEDKTDSEYGPCDEAWRSQFTTGDYTEEVWVEDEFPAVPEVVTPIPGRHKMTEEVKETIELLKGRQGKGPLEVVENTVYQVTRKETSSKFQATREQYGEIKGEPIFWYYVRWCGCNKNHVQEKDGEFSCDEGSKLCGVVEVSRKEYFLPPTKAPKSWQSLYTGHRFTVSEVLGEGLFPKELKHEKPLCQCFYCFWTRKE
eukprot:GHVP01038782.1.p1 GENE.GHVP01038782.1~~GHVP01038782.1.p1  ORF type:complete len:236 (-),score=38.32 GHVP01038782.1:17-634(-)